jgi:undecaprenyl-diphosphatase
MGLLEAIILGIIQGLTEFLPVSSSGHLELVKALFPGDQLPEESLLITVVLHGATALSTVVVFRKEVLELVKGLFQFKRNESFDYSMKIVVSMIPAGFVGFYFNDTLEVLFNGQIFLVGMMLIVTGLLLFFADRAKASAKGVGFRDAVLIGIAQAIAILPGISRSGATISTSVLLGIDRDKAARFSFLMVVPLILGKMAKDLLDGALMDTATGWMPLTAGFLSAFIVGILACNWMITLVRNSKLRYFAYYCFGIGITTIIWISF